MHSVQDIDYQALQALIGRVEHAIEHGLALDVGYRTNKASFHRNPIIGNRGMNCPIALSTPESSLFSSVA